MIQITPHMRILVSVDPVDFRKGIDGLVLRCTPVGTNGCSLIGMEFFEDVAYQLA